MLKRSFDAKLFSAQDGEFLQRLVILLYHAGYYTAKSYEPIEGTTEGIVTLGFTNAETEKSIRESVEKSWNSVISKGIMNYLLNKVSLTELLDNDDYDGYFCAIRNAFNIAEEEERSERFFHNWIYYGHYKELGAKCQVEYRGAAHTEKHIDMHYESENFINLFEFKYEKELAKAFKQFVKAKYIDKFAEQNKKKRIRLIGINFKHTIHTAAVYIIELGGCTVYSEFIKQTGNVAAQFAYVYPDSDTRIAFDEEKKKPRGKSKKKKGGKKSKEAEEEKGSDKEAAEKAKSAEKGRQKPKDVSGDEAKKKKEETTTGEAKGKAERRKRLQRRKNNYSKVTTLLLPDNGIIFFYMSLCQHSTFCQLQITIILCIVFHL
eukprot:TRINITY_DN1412_c0_g1_i3.p2 TRINITY_DN1412_c0_g1~~TRINITY_DN1412_c0_g1_i3.p2  ORF type:complete len:376 (+),score=36.65 TRINITY_DN1412_c0_g1_i3:2642-3769(+)